MADRGERSPFIAGQRVGRARRRRARWISQARWVAGLTLGVAAAGAALGGTAHWLLSAPRFDVAGVEVRGASRVAPERIREAAGVQPGTNLFRLRPREIVARVEALAEVRRAEVVRELPDRIAVQVEERTPFTLVAVSDGNDAFPAPAPPPARGQGRDIPARAGRLVWIDVEGRVIGEERRAVVSAAPLISGIAEAEVARGHPDAGPRVRAAIALILSVLRSGGALGDEIAEVDMGRAGGPVLLTMSGVEVHLGTEYWGGDDWPDRLARLQGVLATVAAQHPDVSVVDLRFKDQVVLRRGGQPSDGRRPKS
jgi:cell division septal protein FtsQ